MQACIFARLHVRPGMLQLSRAMCLCHSHGCATHMLGHPPHAWSPSKYTLPARWQGGRFSAALEGLGFCATAPDAATGEVMSTSFQYIEVRRCAVVSFAGMPCNTHTESVLPGVSCGGRGGRGAGIRLLTGDAIGGKHFKFTVFVLIKDHPPSPKERLPALCALVRRRPAPPFPSHTFPSPRLP
jgi:hypothetical protein